MRNENDAHQSPQYFLRHGKYKNEIRNPFESATK